MNKRILIMAAGTGGHVFPALAVAKTFKQEGVRVAWLASRHGMEIDWILAENIPIFTLSIGGLRGKGWYTKLLAPFTLCRALVQALRIIAKVKPDVVLGMGGFVTGPGGLAACLCNIPLVIHEQNAIAGLTNQLLATHRFFRKKSIANCVLQAFPNTFPKICQPILTGNPVRDALLQLPPPEQRYLSQMDKKQFHVLVLGGSGGAQAINQTLPRAMALLKSNLRPAIYHQTGKKNYDVTKALYESYEVEANVVGFIDDMNHAYQWADIVICRAGAMTLAELCSVGLGSILVPFPHAVDDHQSKNAAYLVQAGAAIVMPQHTFTPEALANQLTQFSVDKKRLLTMAKQAYELRIPDATKKVVECCKTLMGLS